jgi:hypothetical protein
LQRQAHIRVAERFSEQIFDAIQAIHQRVAMQSQATGGLGEIAMSGEPGVKRGSRVQAWRDNTR